MTPAEAGVTTIAVGLIVDPRQAEDVLAAQSADLIAIGRQALLEPNWPLYARRVPGDDTSYAAWPAQCGW
ncbi:flavin oxidoreductase / NADH oxidase family protein [Paraburkholderia xenovorans LB400]|uniref:oxidoreductase n=1 Tax=Paraburkholderia xenovorans TaxID=36873 RepID=UPI000037EADD|nr:hypothetical protein [Paraburkholderia xenovorans]AIP34927.1 flavin oxidoreductase / NADH oxidase family protein [Paraburkholderia xenovorans LB400]